MKKSLSAVAAVGAAAALLLLGAPAANAAPPADLPAAQDLYAIDCDDYGAQLWVVAPSGASTPIGDKYLDGTSNDCGGGAQRNPVTGISYFVFYPAGGGGTQLATVDLVTGDIAVVGTLTGDSTDAWQFFITNDGTAYITSNDASRLLTISLTTAVTTLVAPVTPVTPDTMGYNPVTDTIYAIERDDTVEVYTVDRLTGVLTDTGFTGVWPTGSCLTGGTAAARPDALVFDSAGFGWIQSDSCESVVMAVDFTDGSAAITGELFDSTGTVYTTAPNEFYSETFIVGPAVGFVAAPAPGLAATGVDSDALVITSGVAALAAVVGVALFARSRRRTA